MTGREREREQRDNTEFRDLQEEEKEVRLLPVFPSVNLKNRLLTVNRLRLRLRLRFEWVVRVTTTGTAD